MHWSQLLSTFVLSTGVVSARRSVRHVGAFADKLAQRSPALDTPIGFGEYQSTAKRATTAEPLFLTSNTTKFSVNGTGIPDVDFDIGESYAGSLSLSSDPDDENNLFFWFFPSTNPSADKEILIWLNGGPGCSSFEGLLQENGPFLWQYGTYKPIENPWSWNKLTHVVYIEQPVGTGFSQGTPTATSEEDIAAQFMGFWKNFVETFAMQGYKVYIAGESYAGQFVPYIASAFLDANDTTYYNASGILIYDPSITSDPLQQSITVLPFVEHYQGLFPFNSSFMEDIKARDAACGYTDFMNKYLTYPPTAFLPAGEDLPGTGNDSCENIYWDIFNAALLVNPCFDIYQIATTCPLLWDVLGFPGSIPYSPDGSGPVYFDRADVKAAIHAPNITWEECSSDNVFVNGSDSSAPSANTVLPGVIDRTQNVIIGHGLIDMILLANGTLLAIQNMTWGGLQGFQTAPTESFYVPYHNEVSDSTSSASGVMGNAHTERGLTYVTIELCGHMVPQYQPSAAFRHLEFLLGRVSGLSSVEPFTTDPNVTQATAGELGNGTASTGSIPTNTSTTAGETTSPSAGSKGVVAPSVLACLAPLVMTLFAVLAF